MKIKKHEVQSMTDKQFKFVLKAFEIIVELAKDDTKAIKNALAELQSVFEQPK